MRYPLINQLCGDRLRIDSWWTRAARVATSISVATLLFVTSLNTAVGASSEWIWHRTSDGLHPNGVEQQRLWLINRARANPRVEGEWLATTGLRDIREPRAYFGVDTEKLKREFAAIKPSPPAAFDARLYYAALDHARDMIARDTQDHSGQFELISKYDYPYRKLRGNVFSYAKNSLYAHAGLNIDWGEGTADGMQSPRGHRMGIMATDGPYPNVGIAVLRESDTTTEVGPFVHVDNFAQPFADGQTSFSTFIVGTVWQDRNDNGRFEAGEGLSDVVVTPSRGAYYAVTAKGGGYAIPITERGNARIRFTGGGLADYSVSRKLGNQSVLVDYEVSPQAVTQTPQTTPATDVPAVADIWLDRDQKDIRMYGHRAGGVAARERVRAQFWGQGDDLRLTMRGWDIDRRGEVTVSLNGHFVANLRTGQSNKYNGGDVILLAKELQRANGNNDIVIEQSTVGHRWGVSNLLLTALQPGSEINLDRGKVSKAARGFRYGGDRHKGAVIATFPGASEDLRFSVVGYDIDASNEAVVFFNGKRIGALRRGSNNSLNAGNTFTLKAAAQKAAANRLVIVQRKLGNRWGVRDLLLR